MDCLGKCLTFGGAISILNTNRRQCCFMTYERLVEAIVSLFVPFYDEFKGIAILFLILTRARVRYEFPEKFQNLLN